MIEVKQLSDGDINSDMFVNFKRRQKISSKYVKHNGGWIIAEADELREWNREKLRWIPDYLREQLKRGGSVFAAYEDDTLAGFGSADGYLRGETAKYANLSMLFVDDRMKRKGIGRLLFEKICKSAAEHGADKLFISAIPSAETIAFYFSMGCIDADEIISEYIDTENDRYLEFLL